MNLDERTQAELKRWMRKAGIYLGTFVAGGVFALSYSYYSLHGAKDRKIDRLEDQLATGLDKATELERELGRMRVQAVGQPDRQAFDELQEELAGTTTRQAELERKLERADRKVAELEKSRGTWKSKYAKMETSRDELQLQLEELSASNSVAEDTTSPNEGLGGVPASPSQDAGTAVPPSARATEFAPAQSLASTDPLGAVAASGDYWEANRERGPNAGGPTTDAP